MFDMTEGIVIGVCILALMVGTLLILRAVDMKEAFVNSNMPRHVKRKMRRNLFIGILDMVIGIVGIALVIYN